MLSFKVYRVTHLGRRTIHFHLQTTAELVTFDLHGARLLEIITPKRVAVSQDALLAQLLGMGFGLEKIKRCQVAMASFSHPGGNGMARREGGRARIDQHTLG